MKKSKYAICLIAVLAALFIPVMPVRAAGAIGSTDSFNDLNGDAKYLGSGYWRNYYLDIEELELLDSGYKFMNGIANFLFTFCKWLAYLTVTIFYLCFNLNLADLFGSQVNAIQQALNESIFSSLFLFGCAMAFCVLMGRMMKQDLAGALGQIVKVICIVILSVLVVRKSDVILSFCNNYTKEISIEVLTGMNTATGMEENISDFAAEGAGVLWKNLIHEPWLTLEFDNDGSIQESDIEAFLTLKGGSEERKALAEGYDLACFKKEYVFERLGFMILYLIPFLLKCGVYLLVAVIQLVFQLLAILYMFMAPLVLIISLVPGYERIIGSWFRKILESQISILIVSLIIGILIKFDELIFDWAAANSYGWLIALALQTATAIGLFLNRNKLLNVMADVQRGISNPRYLRANLRNGSNVYRTAPIAAKNVKYLAGKTGDLIKKKGNSISEGMNRPVSWTVNPFLISQRKQEEAKAAARQASKAASANQQENGQNVKQRKQSDVQDVQQNINETMQQGKGQHDTARRVEKNHQRYARPENSVPSKSEAIKEIADELSRNLNQLSAVIERAEDEIREESSREKNDNDDRRPVLMGEKKEEEKPNKENGENKENKEITVNVKGADGKEESRRLKPSESMDMKTMRNQEEQMEESGADDRPRTNKGNGSGGKSRRKVKTAAGNAEEVSEAAVIKKDGREGVRQSQMMAMDAEKDEKPQPSTQAQLSEPQAASLQTASLSLSSASQSEIVQSSIPEEAAYEPAEKKPAVEKTTARRKTKESDKAKPLSAEMKEQKEHNVSGEDVNKTTVKRSVKEK